MYSFKSQDEYKKIHHNGHNYNFFLFRIFPGVWTCETKGNRLGKISFGDVPVEIEGIITKGLLS